MKFVQFLMVAALFACGSCSTAARFPGDSGSPPGMDPQRSRQLFAQDIALFGATTPSVPRTADPQGACSGFAVFRFGETRAALASLAMKYYGLVPSDKIPMAFPTRNLPSKCGFSFRSIDDAPNVIHLDEYPIGGRLFSVDLLFNFQGRFYRFELRERPSVGPREYDVVCGDRERFLADIFRLKFGMEGVGCLPAILRVGPEGALARVWHGTNVTAGTEVCSPGTFHYFVQGFVECNDVVAAEASAIQHAQQKAAVEASKDF